MIRLQKILASILLANSVFVGLKEAAVWRPRRGELRAASRYH